MLENPMTREERTPRDPHHSPSYAGIELSTQAQRDAANAAMVEQLKREMEESQREQRQSNFPIKPVA